MNVPNTLTVARILLVPVLAVVFYLPFTWAPLVCAMLFALAAVTDWADGFLARRLSQVSTFGTFLDPVADKLMVAVALVLLVQHDPTPWIAVPAAIIVCREIVVSALRELMAELGQRATVAGGDDREGQDRRADGCPVADVVPVRPRPNPDVLGRGRAPLCRDGSHDLVDGDLLAGRVAGDGLGRRRLNRPGSPHT